MTAGCLVCARLPPETTRRISFPDAVLVGDELVLDRIRGALLGTALGDALGDRARHGQPIHVGVIPEPDSLWAGGATQLTLFSTEGLLRMLVRYSLKGIGPAFDLVRDAGDRWLFTQDPGHVSVAWRQWHPDEDGWPTGWLVREHVLHHRRSRMTTTVAAVRLGLDVDLAEDRRPLPRPNASVGSGALVHAAPAGWLVPQSFAFEMGVRAAAYTHGGADAYLAAGVVSRVVAGLLAGDPPRRAIEQADDELTSWPDNGPTRRAIAWSLGTSPTPPRLGAAWDALPALAVALRTFTEDPADVVEAIRVVAAEAGTAAAVLTGLFLGARHGSALIDPAWQAACEVRAIIEELAITSWLAHRAWVLHRVLPEIDEHPDTGDEHPLGLLLWPRYPGW